jgi:hypothetical protein
MLKQFGKVTNQNTESSKDEEITQVTVALQAAVH